MRIDAASTRHDARVIHSAGIAAAAFRRRLFLDRDACMRALVAECSTQRVEWV